MDDLLTVARHALTDLAGAASATALEVDVTVTDGGVRLQVATDGTARYGSPDGNRVGMGRHAAVRGVPLVTEPHPAGGTRLTWAVALH